MAHATKRGRHWRRLVFSHYEYKDGKKIRKYKSFTGNTKREAERLAAQYEYDKAHAPKRMTVHDAIDQYISIKHSVLSPSTETGYRSYLKTGKFSSIEALSVTDVDQLIIQTWIADMLEDYSAKYTRNCYGLLRPALTMAGVANIPVTLPPLPTPETYVPTDAELSQLLEYLDQHDKTTKAAAMLAAFGSMRRSEICALTPADFDGDTVKVNKAIVKSPSGIWVSKPMPKTPQSHRTVSLPHEVLVSIDKSGERIIPLNPDQLSKRFRKAVKHAGMPALFCLHSLRHYYASIAHVLGIPDQYVMKMGGWKTDYVLKKHYRTTLTDVEQMEQDKFNAHFSKVMQPKCNQDAEKR